MKLAIIAPADPTNVLTWSGIPYYMTNSLRAEFPSLYPVRSPRPEWFRYLRGLAWRASGGQFELRWSILLAEWNGEILLQKLIEQGADIVLSIANSPLGAYLSSKIPTIHVSDTTLPLMQGYYPEFSRLPGALAAQALQLDRASVLQSRACLYPSEWAASSAIRDYGADPSRIHVIPWGANLEARVSYERNHRSSNEICNLIFIGVDWLRKGGDIAAAATTLLSELGYSVQLHVIGPRSKIPESNSILYHGFINKNTANGRDKFDSIMKQGSFLFVPTRQDCYGIVFAEASAYGLPIITTRTGGVSGVVADGVNGYMLPLEATADEYASLIWSIWSNTERYDKLRESSWQRYTQFLNWKLWASSAANIIKSAVTEAY